MAFSDQSDAPVLVRDAFEVTFALKGVQAVKGGFIGGDPAARLNFADQVIASVLTKKNTDEIPNNLLFSGQSVFLHRG